MAGNPPAANVGATGVVGPDMGQWNSFNAIALNNQLTLIQQSIAAAMLKSGGTFTGAVTFSAGLTTTAATISGLGAGIVNSSSGGVLSSSTTLANGVTATTQAALDNSTKVATTAYADNAVSAASSMPTGAVLPFAGSTAPTGYLLCFGQSLNTTTYSALFAVIGYTYGGSGANFNVPDLRGRSPFGADAMGGTAANRLGSGNTGGITGSAALGATGGEQSHTLTSLEQASMSVTCSTFLVGNGGTANAQLISTSAQNVTSNYAATSSFAGTAGGGGNPHNNLPPAIVLNFIIKT